MKQLLAMAVEDVGLEVPFEGGAVVTVWTLIGPLATVGPQVTLQFRSLGLVLALKSASTHRTDEHTHRALEQDKSSPPSPYIFISISLYTSKILFFFCPDYKTTHNSPFLKGKFSSNSI